MDFLVNTFDYNEESVDCTINLFNNLSEEESSPFIKDYRRLFIREIKNRYVSWDLNPSKFIFKKLFGKQNTCKKYTSRNWIWTFSDKKKKVKLVAFVSKEGVQWCYDSREFNKTPQAIAELFKFEIKVRKFISKKIINEDYDNN